MLSLECHFTSWPFWIRFAHVLNQKGVRLIKAMKERKPQRDVHFDYKVGPGKFIFLSSYSKQIRKLLYSIKAMELAYKKPSFFDDDSDFW